VNKDYELTWRYIFAARFFQIGASLLVAPNHRDCDSPVGCEPCQRQW